MLLSVLSFLVVAQSSSEFPEGLMNNPVQLNITHNIPFRSKSNRNIIRATYWVTYLLTPWSRVLLEKLTGFAASQEIPRIFGTGRFITVLTSARHLSLTGANSIQSSQPPPTSWRSILILSPPSAPTGVLLYFPIDSQFLIADNLKECTCVIEWGVVAVWQLTPSVTHLK